MYCHNCGFEINEQKSATCPKCSGFISTELSTDNNPEKEEIFQDIEYILNNDELSELYKDTAEDDPLEREDPFDLDFYSVNQNDSEIASTKENQVKERAFTSKEIPEAEHAPNGSTMKRGEQSTLEEDDETGDEIEPKKTSKFTLVLFFIFSLIIAVGTGVLYLKTKQPAPPAFHKENTSIYENKKSFVLKNDKIQPAVEKPETNKILKAPEQSSIKEPSLGQKKAVIVSKTEEPQKNKDEEKISKKDSSWAVYVPGKQTYYTLQISSLTNRSFAQANLNILKSKEYPVYILLTRNQEGKTIYKLRIGKYETAKKAKKAAEIFYKKEKMKYIILKSNADIDV